MIQRRICQECHRINKRALPITKDDKTLTIKIIYVRDIKYERSANMQAFIEKITSRKFLLALAAFLGSIATTIGGVATTNETLATAGIICAAISAAIYAAAEAYVDAASISANTTTTTTTVSAATTAKDTVEKMLNTSTGK